MKKNLFLLATAALALAACSNDLKVDENTAPVGSNVQKEIAFSTYAQGPKRVAAKSGAIESTTFPTDLDMMVTAYDATNDGDYFDATEFSYATSTWKGSKYWPLTPATINFLAITNANGDNESGVTWGPTISAVESNKTEKVQIVMANNATNQYDLMYACGTGTVSQTNNVLTFPTTVPMEFKHAQAWIKFYVQAMTEASEGITITSIVLNSVSCQGTYTVTHANFDEDKAARDAAGDGSKDGSVSGVWSAYDTYAGNKNVVVDGDFSALDYDAAVLPQYYGSLMVVPAQGIASFTINYTLDGNNYAYTYTPASTTLAQATKYIYNIKLTLHEIEVAPVVEDWTEYGTEYIEIPAMTYSSNCSVSVSKAAQKLVFTISGLDGSKKIKVTKGGTDAAQVSSTNPTLNSVVAETAETQKITIDLAANADPDNDKTMTVTIQEYETDGETTSGTASVITITQTH